MQQSEVLKFQRIICLVMRSKANGEYKRVQKVVFRAVWLYLTALWVYIAVENLVYPALVYNTDFSYYIPIKTDLLGVLSFIFSFVFYILSRI
jgi:hypothetical protein